MQMKVFICAGGTQIKTKNVDWRLATNMAVAPMQINITLSTQPCIAGEKETRDRTELTISDNVWVAW